MNSDNENMELPESTIEDILKYDFDPDDEVFLVLAKQCASLKKAILLFDKVFTNHKNAITSIHEVLDNLGEGMNHNSEVIGCAINEILERLRKIDGETVKFGMKATLQ